MFETTPMYSFSSRTRRPIPFAVILSLLPPPMACSMVAYPLLMRAFSRRANSLALGVNPYLKCRRDRISHSLWLDSLRSLRTSKGMFSDSHADRNLCRIQLVANQQTLRL